jgi:hypothetical protein
MVRQNILAEGECGGGDYLLHGSQKVEGNTNSKGSGHNIAPKGMAPVAYQLYSTFTVPLSPNSLFEIQIHQWIKQFIRLEPS